MFGLIVIIWSVILVILLIYYLLIRKKKNKFNNLLIIDKPQSFKKNKQLNLVKFDNNINDFLGNTTQFTLLTWLVINPVNINSFTKKNSFPLTNILCKGDVNNPVPLILYNHYTNSIYFYVSLAESKSKNILEHISSLGENYWKDLEQNPQNYPNIYILPNILVGRWFQLGFIINSNIFEVYLNAKLKKTFILQSDIITDSNQNLITLGPITSEEKSIKIDGFPGKISGLRYFPEIVQIKDINELYNNGLNNNSYSKTHKVEKSTFNKKPVSIIKSILLKDKDDNLLTRIKNKLTQNKQSVDSLKKNTKLLNEICNKKDYIPQPYPNQDKCTTDCDCFGLAICDTKTSKCTKDDKFKTNQNKHPDCILITSNKDITDNNLGLLTQSTVNSYTCDKLCYLHKNLSQSKPSCKARKGQDAFKKECSTVPNEEMCNNIQPWEGNWINKSSKCLWTKNDPESEVCSTRDGEENYRNQCAAAKNVKECMNIEPWDINATKVLKHSLMIPNETSNAGKYDKNILNNIINESSLYNIKDKMSSKCKWGPVKTTIEENCTQAIYDKHTKKCYKNNIGNTINNYCSNADSRININNIN